jgi:Ca-activated chloride channel family protein
MNAKRLASALIGIGAYLGLSAASAPAHAAQVTLEADLGQSVLHSKSSERIYLRLSLKTLVHGVGEKRAPVNAAIVIDRSGSMAGDRIAAAKEAAHVALERLSADDVVALVAYNHKVDVLQPAHRLGDARDSLERAIDRLYADGTTALYAGVKEGGQQVREFISDNKINRVILLSDGLANVGPSQPSDLAELGRELASKGISVTTIGLGLEYNEDLMQRLAAASDGNHAFVESPRQLAEIFDKEFGDALSVSARDVIIHIECRAGFRPSRVLGREAEIKGQTITMKLNQLQSLNERYIVVELEATGGNAAGEAEIADVSVDYFDLDGGSRNKVDRKVKARISDDLKEAEASLNKSVMTQVTEQIATETSEKAVELRDKGDVAGARRMLEENASYLNKEKSRLGTGAAAAPSAAIKTLDELEQKNREAASNLDGEAWGKARKAMRYDQHKSKMQQSY